MKTKARKNWSINHFLTPLPENTFLKVQQQPKKATPSKIQSPYKVSKQVNPHTQRSKKHRLMEEKNLQIEKTNRMLYERIRKIKLKNMYQSQKKIEHQSEDDSQPLLQNFGKNLLFPQIAQIKKSTKSSTTISNQMPSMNSTKKSFLDSILEDRVNFVQKYFNDLSQKKHLKTQQKELGVFMTENEWKVKVLLVENENIILIGKKGRKELTKKYLYSKVKDKMQNGLEQWVKYKFSFQN